MSSWGSVCECKHLASDHRGLRSSPDRYRCEFCVCAVTGDGPFMPVSERQWAQQFPAQAVQRRERDARERIARRGSLLLSRQENP